MNKRHYDSPLRSEQARATRARILTSASELFVEGEGYAATTITQIAASAGVSAQTVYNVFGTKAAVLKAAYDVRVVGDDEPVPLAARPELAALHRLENPRDFLAGYARVGMAMLVRLGPLLAKVGEGAAAGDADLRALVETTGRERRFGAASTVDRVIALGALRDDLPRDRAIDLVWTAISFEIWDLLVNRCGWSPEEYADHLGRALADALLA